MADADAIGGKRKYKENAFTAKAESGTLKVKILRKDLRNAAPASNNSGDASGAAPLSGFLAATRTTASQQQKHHRLQHEQQTRSPPKPRPNRKHVPIFYQQRAPAAMESSSSSTDESMAGGMSQSVSTTSVEYNESSTTSQDSSGAGRFSSLLSGLHLDSNGGGGLPRPPPSNPLFARNDSDGTSSIFGDLLRHSFPSAQGPAPPPAQLGNFMHTSSSSLHHNSNGQGETASALHQLASSAYGSSLASLSSAARGLSDANSSSSGSQSQQQGYRFNPFTALQSAIDVHQATIGSSSSSHVPYQYPHERQQQNHSSAFATRQDANMGDDLGPPPSAPPAFGIQNSLIGGGIEMQPVIANVNTHNFDWSSGRPRSGSLPNILEGTASGASGNSSSSGTGAGKTSGGSNSSVAPTASNVHMWKEV